MSDTNAHDRAHCSALFYAARAQHADVVRTLLASGADVTIRDVSGHSALHVAKYKTFGFTIRNYPLRGIRPVWTRTEIVRF